MESVLVRGGIVVDAGQRLRADILVRGGVVERVGAGLRDRADRVVEADGCLVLPGVLDVHTHPVYLDDLESLPVTAAHGGVTTVLHYAYARPGQGLVDTLQRFREEASSVSILDFGLHGGLFEPKRQADEIPAAVSLGVTSFKLFMTYAKLGWMTDDYQLQRTLDLAARSSALVAVHAENGLATDYLEDAMNAAGQDPIETFMATRPAVLEAEAVHRAMAMAAVAGAALYIPHVSAAPALDEITRARSRGWWVYAETCPQYLTLTNRDLLEKKALLKIGPPLREDGDREALWRGLAEGQVDVIASDHAAKDKRAQDDFFAAPFGTPQTETMLPLIYSEGVAKGRLSIERLVQTLCENPAKIFGLFPRKGTLRPGSDADLVVLDPRQEDVVAHATQHSRASYTAYEGWRVAGRVTLTMRRGEVLVEDGVCRNVSRGRFLETSAGRVDPAALRSP
ncbi:MAG: dihydropyrimidinase [Candidatus Bipolaricaulota bacterium]